MRTETNGVRTKVMTIDADHAKKMLEKNTCNRRLSNDRVVEIMGWIRKGQWRLTTDAIGFSSDGNLINGQHRLHAIVKTGKPVDLLVATGLEPDAFNVIDTVKVRSAADVLGVNDYASPAIKSAIIRFVMTWQKQKYAALTVSGYRPTNQEVLDFADRNRDKINAACTVAQQTTSKFRGLSARYIGGLYWVFADLDKDSAETFFKYFQDGVGLTPNDPILVLRQKLIGNLAAYTKAPIPALLAWTIIAWNHTRSGKKIKIIRWTENDEFPKPI